MKALILGGGFAGCTIARLLTNEGWDCTIVDKEKFVGGGCRTFFYGGHPFTYGPRPYYGYSEKIFKWIDSFIEMRKFPFSLLSYIEPDQRFYSYPIHEDEIPEMREKSKIYNELKERDLNKTPGDFEEYWISRVGKTLYNMFVNQYSQKMWLIDSNKKIDTFKWSAKDNPINSGRKECYKGSLIGYPVDLGGYNQYFEKAVSGVNLILGEMVKGVDLKNKTINTSDGRKIQGDILISTIPVEELCNFEQGDLPYAGRKFTVFVLPCKQVFPGDIRFCHYTQSEPYTRIVEYKKLTYYESEDTLMVMEFPSNDNKLYPYMINEYQNLAESYLKSLPDGVFSIGRLGTYKYTTIEQTIWQSFSLFKAITGKSIDKMEEELYQIGDTALLHQRKNSNIISSS